MKNDDKYDEYDELDIEEISLDDGTYDDMEFSDVDYSEYIDHIPVDDEDDEDQLFNELTDSLGHQVSEELGEYVEEDFMDDEDENEKEKEKEPKKKKKFLKIFLIVIGIILAFAFWLVGTPSGRRFGLGIVAKIMHNNMDIVDDEKNDDRKISPPVYENVDLSTPTPYEHNNPGIRIDSDHRSEDYVTNYLIFGIEEIDGAANTDAMMIVSINTKDNSIKLTSLLRDTLVAMPGYKRNKLNSAYARGARGAQNSAEAKQKGAEYLIGVIEDTYDVEIAGFACVNFKGFETVVDRLGGIDIELGKSERIYLNNTNYISNPANRTLVDGWNHMNGNQVLGYVRVRKRPTLGGANNDYGRTVRQRRVINAIISKYKSASIFEMIDIMTDCLNVVTTNLTEEQIRDALVDVVENSIYSIESMRLPADELFYDSGSKGYEGITYALVIDDYQKENIKRLHQFIFLDPVEEAVTQ